MFVLENTFKILLVFNSVRPEVLTADELLEDMDMDMGEESAREISPRVHQTVDSGLSASGKMDSYHSARWRLEVCCCACTYPCCTSAVNMIS